MSTPRKGECGGTPRVGRSGDVKPRGTGAGTGAGTGRGTGGGNRRQTPSSPSKKK